MIIPHIVEKLPNHEQCKIMSEYKGVVYRNSYSVSHVVGKTTDCYILSCEWEQLRKCRETVCGMVGREDIKYTYPGMARQISEWLNIRESRGSVVPREFIPKWHYQLAIPTYQKRMHMYDMRSAYWQVAAKSKSLLCKIDINNNKVIWLCMGGQQEQKWNDCKRILEPYKKLRLAIIGTNSTGWTNEQNQSYYVRGELKKLPGSPPTSFQSLALLTVRVAYELTQLQVNETDCWYANADSILTSDYRLKLWDDMGIEYRDKAYGDCEVRGIGAWKVGETNTIPYEHMLNRGLLSGNNLEAYNIPLPKFHENIFN